MRAAQRAREVSSAEQANERSERCERADGPVHASGTTRLPDGFFTVLSVVRGGGGGGLGAIGSFDG